MLREVEKGNFTTGWDFRIMTLTPLPCPSREVCAKLRHGSSYHMLTAHPSLAPCAGTPTVCSGRKPAKTANQPNMCCNFLIKMGRKTKSTLDLMQSGT